MDRARVLVVEDDITVRNLLEAVLRSEGYDIAIASTSAEALAEARRRPPDIAIVDVRLGGGPDGLTVARRLREDRELPILVVSAADSGEDLRAGFAAGADFYVTKPFSVDDLIVRVEVLLRRDRKSGSLIRAVGDMEVDEGGHSVRRAGTPIDLTPREFDLLCALARRPGRVVAKPQLLSEIWGHSHGRNLVETHMSSLRKKLEAHGPRLIHTVRGVGYVIRG